MKRNALPPRLKKGELVRLIEDGPVWTVVRTTPCAAYVKRSEWLDDKGKVLGGLETGIESISLHSFVFRSTDDAA